MPFLPGTISEDADSNQRLAMGGASQSDVASVARAMSRPDSGFLSTIAGDLALGTVDLADTVASSIPILSRSFGIQRGQVNSSFLRATGMPGLQDFYNNNREGIEAVSGIGGIIASELVARRITAPASLAMGALKTVPWMRRIASLDAQYDKAMQAVRVADKSLAARGALGAEQFIGRTINAAGQEVSRSSLVRSAKLFGIAKGVRNAAVTEGVMATTLNQNGFLYSDDMSHNMMWMGLGLGVAGAFESVATGYAIRKAANSEEVTRAFSNALDPDMSEASRTLWHGRSVDPKKFKGLADIPEGQGFLGGTITDNVTSLLVGAKSKTGTVLDETRGNQGLFANRDRLATQEMQQAREEIQKVTMKGIEGNGFTRFGNKTANSSGTMNHLDMVMKRDPASMYGIEEIGTSSTHLESSGFRVHEAREARIQNIIDDAQSQIDEAVASGDTNVDIGALQNIVTRYKWKQGFTPQPLIDGERATLSDLQALDGWIEPDVVKSQLPDNVNLWEAKTENTGTRVGLDGNGQVYLPNNQALKDADHFDVMRLYRLGQKMLDTAAQDSKFVMAIPKDANHFQLDLAEEILKANPRARIQFPNGMTRESAQVESFAQKAEILREQGRKGQIKKAVQSRKGVEYDPAVEASRLRVRLNLPRMSAFERGMLGETEHPLETLLRGAAEFGPNEIRKMTLNDLRKGAAEVKRIGDFAPSAASDFESLTGNSFKYMLDEFGQPTKPILMYSRPINQFEWGSDHLAERMAAARLNVVGKLAEGDTFTSNLTKALMGSTDMDAASRTRELMETQVQGSVLGTNHLGAPGAIAKAVKSRDWIGRDNPTLLAASRIQQMTQNLARDNFQQEAKGLQAVASQLDSPRNAASKLLLNQFIAYRSGWDLLVEKGTLITTKGMVPDGSREITQFALAKTQKNADRWMDVFGEAMPEDAMLTAPNGRVVGLDDAGVQFMTEFNKMTESIRQNKNQLLGAQGLRGIDSLPMYVPPKNLDGKFIGFTMDVEGKVVPGMTVIADTEAEFAKQQARIMKEIEDKGLMGYRFRTRDDISRFADIWDRAQMDMIDPGTTAIQGGKASKGLLASPDIDMKGVEGILNTLRTQYMNHSQDILNTVFKDQLRSAESRSNIATALSRNSANPEADQKYRTIHDMYIENLTGRSPLRSKGSPIGWLYNGVEGKVDQILSSMAPGFSRVWNVTNAYIDRAKFWSNTDGAKRDFESLSRYLGDYMPFEDAANYAERLSAGTMPPRLKDLMGTTSRFTAAVMLRIFEPAMAVMNLAGMVNAMPSVIRHVQQQAGESAAEHAARIGHVATIFEAGEGKSIGVLNMGKLMASGFKRAWSKTAEADYDYMRRNGFLTQEVAEFQRQFGAIETKSDWERFMFGDPNAKATRAAKGITNKVATEKGIVGWLSVLTDKSEDFSRSWGHMVGVQLAEELGIKKMEAKHLFAHDLANKMIANYNPANRPEVYQGALGAPLGLFQSFIMNYYQRMFRYLETRDLRSAAVQSAMQAGLFGVPTIPGFSVVSKMFMEASEGDDDPVSAIQRKFGPTAGDVIFGGTLSSIPKIFGAEGVDLYSRGDTAIRLPGSSPVPALGVAQKMFEGIGQAIKLFGDGNPRMSTTQVAEVASNLIPNRPLAGMMEQFFAGGNDTDQAGQIVSETKSMMESVYRIMGVRSMRQSKELEAFYSNKNQMSMQNSQMDMLRRSTRTAFREKDFDAIPQILEAYVERGGDPRNARRWLMEQYKAAVDSRGERQLAESLKSEDKMGYAVRLLDAGVSIDDDEATGGGYGESLQVDSSEFGQVNHEMMDYEGGNVVDSMDQP